MKKIIIIAILCLGGWYLFLRPAEHYNGFTDLRDYWHPVNSKYAAEVYYCGYDFAGCNLNEPYYLDVSYTNRNKAADKSTKWIHTFEINFKNGGHLEVEGTCDKAAEGHYHFTRFCRVKSEDGESFAITPGYDK